MTDYSGQNGHDNNIRKLVPNDRLRIAGDFPPFFEPDYYCPVYSLAHYRLERLMRAHREYA